MQVEAVCNEFLQLEQQAGLGEAEVLEGNVDDWVIADDNYSTRLRPCIDTLRAWKGE